MAWTNVNFVKPPTGVFVNTKIMDGKGERNVQPMKLQNNLWFTKSGNYVYYQPTHWEYIKESYCKY